MTTQNYKLLGHNEEVRARRFKVLQLYLRGANPPEIEHTLGIKRKQVYDDINFLRSIKLNDLPLEIIRDTGANFYEMKVRELQARIALESEKKEKQDRAYILGLEKLILNYKQESMKIQGAYEDPNDQPNGPIQIYFTEVGPDFGKDTAKFTTTRQKTKTARGQDNEQEEEEAGLCETGEEDPEKDYPLY